MNNPTRVALYVRVSSDQTAENQLLTLLPWAKAQGYAVQDYRDEGVSGKHDSRPALDQMMKDAKNGKLDLIAVVSLDRLGRSLSHLVDLLEKLEIYGVSLYIKDQDLDTRTPIGKLMFQITGAFAEFERTLIVERTKAGMQRAKKQGKHIGRPKIPPAVEHRIYAMLKAGQSINQVVKKVRVSPSVACRIAADVREDAKNG